MTKAVYTSVSRVPLKRLISPYWILHDLWRHRELIRAHTRRDFDAMYRNTRLGLLWTVLTPLIMLGIFTLVFGVIFHGHFRVHDTGESPAEFALAMFVGLSLYLCVGNALNLAPPIVVSNAPYVKTMSFPLEILPVSATLILLINLLISLGLCAIGFVLIHGYMYWTAILVLGPVVCMGLMSLGLSWFLSSLAVYVRDVPAITSPLGIVLMYVSAVFFPISSVPKSIQWAFRLNPLAVLVSQGRAAFLYDRVPELGPFAAVFAFSVLVAIGGYWFFCRTKGGFADVV